MKISELSRRTGTPIPTIKFYIREGLVPGGTGTAPNQAAYDEEHVKRLGLIRSLRDVAGLSIPVIGRTLHAIDRVAAGGPAAPPLTIAVRALSPELEVPRGAEEAFARATTRVEAVLRALGWRCEADSAGYADLVRALVAIEREWPLPFSKDLFLAYGRIAEQTARLEIPEEWDPGVAPAQAVHYAVLGTVLFEPVLIAFRRLAHVDRNRRLITRRVHKAQKQLASPPVASKKRRGGRHPR